MEKDIAQIFGLVDMEVQDCINVMNRRIMGKILSEHLKAEVILNPFTEKNRMSYLIGSKIYALRTRSRELAKKASFR